MVFYFSYQAFLIALLVLSKKVKRYSGLFIALLFISIFTIPGIRGDVGSDTFSYQYYFNETFASLSSWVYIFDKEPVFYFIMYIVSNAVGSFTVFLLVISFIQTVLAYEIYKHLYYRNIFILLYLLVYLIDYHMNIMRASLSLLLFLYSLVYLDKNSEKKSYILFAMSVLTHFSAVVFVPIFLLSIKKSIRYKAFFVIFLCLFMVCFYYFFSSTIMLKLSSYNIFENFKFNFSMVAAGFSVLLFFSLLVVKRVPITIFYSALYFVVFFCLVMVFEYASRFYFMLYLVLIFTVCQKRKALWPRNLNVFFLTVLFLLSTWFYITSMLSIQQESERIRSFDVKIDTAFEFIPYSTFIESRFR